MNQQDLTKEKREKTEGKIGLFVLPKIKWTKRKRRI